MDNDWELKNNSIFIKGTAIIGFVNMWLSIYESEELRNTLKEKIFLLEIV